MLRRVFLVLLPLALLAVSCAYADVDAGVKGTAAIATSSTGVGVLDINVAKSGDVLSGGFRYTDYSSISASVRPGHVISSQTVTSLTVVGGRAVVQAVGFWNGMLSDLTVEVVDRAPGVDWFQVVARPRGPLTIIYDKAGDVIKGDLVVVGGTPAPGIANGVGAIRTIAGVGSFEFKAQQTSAGVGGYAYYLLISSSTSPVARQGVRIYLPRVERLSIVGRTAVLGGKGTLNGIPALIEIRAIDNAAITPTSPVKPDEFYITATPVSTDSSLAAYSAGGPLIKGDIVVKSP